VKGRDVIDALQRTLRCDTKRSLAIRLGVSGQAIQDWINRSSVTPRQIAGLVKKSINCSLVSSHATALRPLVEFFPITKVESRGRAKFELFTVKDGRGAHPYLTGLRDELAKAHGVYIFFDSRGQAIYAGKARRTFLWAEMTSAFNRDRDSVQTIKRVRHPVNRISYKTSDEKARQIQETAVPLYELAHYFSAYQVADGLIDDLESLLVRGFANDVLNIRMERFTRHRKASKTKRPRRRKTTTRKKRRSP
jgi:hypothetical protein